MSFAGFPEGWLIESEQVLPIPSLLVLPSFVMKYLIWGLFVLLTLLQQDYLNWFGSPQTVAGFLPLPLAYHVAISLAAAGLWLVVTKFCWPEDLEPPLEAEERAV